MITDEQCIAIYNEVSLTNVTRDVKTPEKKIAAVRRGLGAQQAELPTEFRVTTEWDAFNSTTPREAALEVWEAIKTSSGPVFTVYGRDGSVTDIDLEVDA